MSRELCAWCSWCPRVPGNERRCRQTDVTRIPSDDIAIRYGSYQISEYSRSEGHAGGQDQNAIVPNADNIVT
jgi:hypothetical protein